jgi:predicted cytidylate kinase
LSVQTLTVGGLPGTGTTTLCRLLERSLQLPYIYAGQLFREEAVKRGMTLAEFNALASEDPAVDRALDDQQLEMLRRGGVILEGRLAGWLADHHHIPAFKVWIVCEEEERIGRLVQRDGGDAQTQRRLLADRESRERDRYARYYGADLTDQTIYDLVLDSTSLQPEEVRDRVLEAVDALSPGGPGQSSGA